MAINRFKRTLSIYTTFIRWFLHDSIWRFKFESFIILTSGILGVFFQVQVFGLIMFYAKHFSSGKIIEHWGYTFDFRSSEWLLILVSISVFISLTLAALCIYISRVKTLNLARKYGDFCSKRVLNLISSSPLFFQPSKNLYGPSKYLLKLSTTDSRFSNRVLRSMLYLIVPFLTLFVAMIILIYLEPLLTIIVIGLLCIYIISQYRISRKGATHSLSFELKSPQAVSEIRSIIDSFKYQPNYYPDYIKINQLFLNGAVKEQMDAYEGRIKVVEYSRMLSMVNMAFTIAVIMAVMGSYIILEGVGWGRLLAYIIALRFAMTNIQKCFSLITSINRFYPQVRRYFNFIQSFGSTETKTKIVQPDDYKITAKKNLIENSEKKITLNIGDRVAIVSLMEPNRYSMATFAETLFNKNNYDLTEIAASMRFVSAKHSYSQSDLYSELNLDVKTNMESVKYWFPNEILWDKAKKSFPEFYSTTPKKNIWDSIEPEIKVIFSLISAANSDSRFILIDSESLKILDKNQISFYLDYFKDKIVFLTYTNDFCGVGINNEKSVVVIDEDGIIGIGSSSWFSNVRLSVEDRLLSKSKKNKMVENDDDDFDDDDDE